jgi:hypothetical protein
MRFFCVAVLALPLAVSCTEPPDLAPDAMETSPWTSIPCTSGRFEYVTTEWPGTRPELSVIDVIQHIAITTDTAPTSAWQCEIYRNTYNCDDELGGCISPFHASFLPHGCQQVVTEFDGITVAVPCGSRTVVVDDYGHYVSQRERFYKFIRVEWSTGR